jgi:hypothetical protein
MNHQPFETWIVEGSPLSKTQDKELWDHLSTCNKCNSLNASMQEVERQIKSLPVMRPKIGFTSRWKDLAIERQARALEQQSRRLLYGMAAAAALLLVLVVINLVFNGSPMSWFIGLMETCVETIVGLKVLQNAIFAWIRTVPLTIQLAIWIPITTIFGFLGMTWVIALWRIPTQGVQVS